LRRMLTLGEPRILKEQLRLLLRNSTSSTVSGVLLATLMAITLETPTNRQLLGIWWACEVAWRLFSTWAAVSLLSRPSTYRHARRTIAMSMGINGIEMVLWGALAWLTLDDASLTSSVLVIAVLAAITSNTMATLSPVYPVFMVTMAVQVVVVAGKAFSMTDPAYEALGVAAILYALTQLLHGLNVHDTVKNSIQLRFDNERLIAELHAKSEHAKQAQLEAETANQDKSRFLAAASHDLRQPIHAQGLFLEVMSDNSLDAPTRARVLDSAKAAWQASSDMLNTLLDFSRIEAGVLKPQISIFCLQPLLHRIEAEIAPQADAKCLVYRTRETPLAVRSDPALVELILRNLASNAVRYTEQGGVLVGVRRRGQSVLLQVWDTGAGIAQEDRENIFREFYQLGNPERDRHKGLGLGLAIAKGLATELRHELSLNSVLGRGSCFTLEMPLSLAPVIETDALRAPVSLRPLGLRVLVIDDDDMVRHAMQRLLQSWQCDCVVSESAEAVMAMQGMSAPEIILSDYRLRDQQTGAQAIEQLRQHWGAPIPAILLTGDTARERLREVLSSGIPLMHKPVSPQQLHQEIERLLVAGAY
jgi:two-component system, sensor histidine kinase